MSTWASELGMDTAFNSVTSGRSQNCTPAPLPGRRGLEGATWDSARRFCTANTHDFTRDFRCCTMREGQ